VIYKLVAALLFYNRLTNLSESAKEIYDLKFYSRENDLKLRIHSLSDGLFSGTHCIAE